jgi:hypothetical protein
VYLAPSNITRAIQDFLCPQLQDYVGMRADRNACGGHITKHGIENSPVPTPFNGIDPYQNAVNLHELLANFRAKIIVIYRRLDVHPLGGKGPEQLREPVILLRRVPPRLVIARVENRHSPATILRHRVFFHWSSVPCSRNV